MNKRHAAIHRADKRRRIDSWRGDMDKLNYWQTAQLGAASKAWWDSFRPKLEIRGNRR